MQSLVLKVKRIAAQGEPGDCVLSAGRSQPVLSFPWLDHRGPFYDGGFILGVQLRK